MDNEILRRESFSLNKTRGRVWPVVYDDATGKALKKGDVVKGTPTIGYGFTRLSKEEARTVLAMKIEKIISHDLMLFQDVLPHLNEVRLAVLISMIYQLGAYGVKTFKNTLKAIKREDWREVHDQMLDSKWAREDSPNRAKKQAKMMLNG